MTKAKYIVTVIVILVSAGVIFLAEDIGKGIINGIELCIHSVIPALFMFSVVSIFIVKAGLFNNNRLIDVISYILFGRKGETGAVSVLSLISGYPVGSAMVNELYVNNKIDQSSALKMLNFCINPGPAFIIGLIGNGIYGSSEIGLILLTASLLSTIICGRINLRNTSNVKIQESTGIDYTSAFLKSVNLSVRNMGIVCGWVLIASAITEILSKTEMLNLLSCFLEVTSGVGIAAKFGSIYLVAFLLGFGGLCVQLQAISTADAIHPKYFNILLWKTIHGLLTSMFTYILLKIFPQTIEVSNVVLQLDIQKDGGNMFSAFVTILFILSTIIFINEKLNKCRKL